jgi:hypothetical protein
MVGGLLAGWLLTGLRAVRCLQRGKARRRTATSMCTCGLDVNVEHYWRCERHEQHGAGPSTVTSLSTSRFQHRCCRQGRLGRAGARTGRMESLVNWTTDDSESCRDEMQAYAMGGRGIVQRYFVVGCRWMPWPWAASSGLGPFVGFCSGVWLGCRLK